MGQGIMQDVAGRMIGDMARNMEAMLAAPADGADETPPPAAPAPIKGGSLALAVLWQRLRRLFTRSRS
jgi:hypothetical protein